MNSIEKKLLLVSLMSIYCFIGLIAQNLSVFVCSHPDDWHFSMNPNAHHQLAKSNHKVLFLHTTAGDAGISDNSYYLAREEGSLRAIRFMESSLYPEDITGSNMNPEQVNLNGHAITKYTYGNAVVYCLYLPDGGINGAGFITHNYESLQRLYNGSISTISAIDNSTTYNSLTDLETTIQQLIQSEVNSSDSIDFNLADTDESINPGDHPDHIISSRILQKVASTIGRGTLNLYKDYLNNSEPQNIFDRDYLICAATWGATISAIIDKGGYSAFQNNHIGWIGKQYYRTKIVNAVILPSAPLDLIASNITRTEFTLSWTASTDTTAILEYNVYQDGILVATVSGTSANIINLSSGKTYSMVVKAKDVAGNISEASDPLLVNN